MYKLVILSAFLAIAVAAPAPSGLVYSSQVLTPVVPVSNVVSPAVTSYSSYSNSVVHGTPVVTAPVVRQAPVAHVAYVHQSPVVQSVHIVPYSYPDHVVVV